MSKKMLKLYKFRSLGEPNSVNRVVGILRTKKFWCSKFWDMNDPMEGVFNIAQELKIPCFDAMVQDGKVQGTCIVRPKFLETT